MSSRFLFDAVRLGDWWTEFKYNSDFKKETGQEMDMFVEISLKLLQHIGALKPYSQLFYSWISVEKRTLF
jgi:hypothetical protein